MDGRDHYGMKGGAGIMADEESASRMMEEAPPAKAGEWKVDDVTIRRAANGGYIVRCSKKREMPHQGGGNGPMPVQAGETYKSDEYAYSSLPEALAFVTQEFGGGAAPARAEGAMAAGDMRDVY